MIRRVKKLRNELGTAPMLSFLFAKVLTSCSKHFSLYHYKFYAQPVSTNCRVPIKKRSNYEFKWLSDYEQILDQLERPQHIIESRFEQGAVCLTAEKDGLFLGCIWLLKKQYLEDEIRATYRFPDNAVWDFDVFVIPKKRLTPLFAILWDISDEWMKEHAVNYSLSRISAHNSNSVRSHESAGAIRIGWAMAILFREWQLSFSSHRPKLHWSRSANNHQPVWYLDPNTEIKSEK